MESITREFTKNHDQLPEIEVFDYSEHPATGYLLHGSRDWGIGYLGGEAVTFCGGCTQPGPEARDKWQWTDRARETFGDPAKKQRGFTVNGRGIWREIPYGGHGPDSGWRTY